VRKQFGSARAVGVRPVLAGLWILDGLLNFQPRMFSQFSGMVAPNAEGQAGLVSYPILHVGHFLSRDVALWTVMVGLVQVGIGVGLLWRRSLRVAVVASFGFGLGVWWLGEGLGEVFDGRASPLAGAPGAVLLYLLLGAVVWLEDEGRSARQLLLGGWTAFWGLSALFWALPDNRSADSVRDQLTAAADGEPGGYAHGLHSLAHALAGAGTVVAVVMVAVSILLAVGPWLARRPGSFLAAGSAVALLFWVTGQAAGALLTGTATDPNIGPLVVLLAFGLWRSYDSAVVPVAPGERLVRLRPGLTAAALAVMVLAPAGVSLVPAAASTSATGSGSSGGADSSMDMNMPGMVQSPGTGTGSAGANIDMPGMDAAAGLGVTEPNWTYTGAPLSAGEIALLDTVGSETDAGHQMQTPNCSTKPTAQQLLGAMEYVQVTSAAVAKYQVLSAAVAAGYQPITSTAYPVVHYVNWAYYSDSNAMDPNHVDSLVYAFTPRGPVLVAAMYLLTQPGVNGPMPYGCLVQWHAHTNLCFSLATGVIVGFAPCSPGSVHQATGMMTHVWQVPVPGGPLAMDPTDLQVVEAAVMAQDRGLAPVTAPDGRVSYLSADASVGKF
jgi:hypothetical protein